MSHHFERSLFRVPPNSFTSLESFDPDSQVQIEDKEAAKDLLKDKIKQLAEVQELLWASSNYSVLIIFQAMDAAGKDGTIKHVMSGINPQGCNVYSFKAPNEEERKHHFMWRPHRYLPQRGMIAIFNRSYYEEVVVTRIHPEFLEKQWISPKNKGNSIDDLMQARYHDINETEKRWSENGIEVIKFFLNVSKEEQRRRFLERLDPEANKAWKFSPSDYTERQHWADYQQAYEQMLNATSTEHAPWYVIPANKKWYMRAVVADIITTRLQKLDLRFPVVSDKRMKELDRIRELLEKSEGR